MSEKEKLVSEVIVFVYVLFTSATPYVRDPASSTRGERGGSRVSKSNANVNLTSSIYWDNL